MERRWNISSAEQTLCINCHFRWRPYPKHRAYYYNELDPQRYAANTNGEPVVWRTDTSRQLRTLQQDYEQRKRATARFSFHSALMVSQLLPRTLLIQFFLFGCYVIELIIVTPKDPILEVVFLFQLVSANFIAIFAKSKIRSGLLPLSRCHRGEPLKS